MGTPLPSLPRPRAGAVHRATQTPKPSIYYMLSHNTLAAALNNTPTGSRIHTSLTNSAHPHHSQSSTTCTHRRNAQRTGTINIHTAARRTYPYPAHRRHSSGTATRILSTHVNRCMRGGSHVNHMCEGWITCKTDTMRGGSHVNQMYEGWITCKPDV